jgi:hypothetical protein
VRKRISIAILLVAGCGGGSTQSIPCDPIVKHDTVRIVKIDTVNIGRIDTVKLTDTIGVYRDVLKIDYWRDTVYVRCDTEFYHINTWGNEKDTLVTLFRHSELDSLRADPF